MSKVMEDIGNLLLSLFLIYTVGSWLRDRVCANRGEGSEDGGLATQTQQHEGNQRRERGDGNYMCKRWKCEGWPGKIVVAAKYPTMHTVILEREEYRNF
ncbi:hypothetical protein B9Z19DRAFT_67423 [Tuber borchii]|uniref:Uncharacterized protein n=1 Tax=Tuber borchii TaxID=42251 RepID=A0A2T6ZSK0_TUBBO|nr:hypothetical protein B9Z19DRAFT_67423 [Tuber borchii]